MSATATLLSMRRRHALMLAAACAASPCSLLAAELASSPGATADSASQARRRQVVAQAIAHAVAQAPLAHAVLVEQRRQLLAETHFTAEDKPAGDWFARTVSFDAGTLHDMRSISKSVVALLVGIAHGQGRIDAERPVMDWFPEHASLATPLRQAMRLQHLLSMTAGLDWDESTLSYASPGNSETRMGLTLDPVGYVLSRDMVAAPGQRFEYSGGVTLLLAAILERATGLPIDDYARKQLFAPLGIEAFEWRHPVLWGKPLPYSGLRLTPRSMIGLGRLVLDEGRHADKLIVPAGWLAQLQRPHVAHTGRGLGYGWQWWVGRIERGAAAGTGWVAGLGHGAQVLRVVPALDATLALTAGQYNSPAGVQASLAICRRVIEALAG